MTDDLPTRARAIRILEQDRAKTLALIDRLPPRALTTHRLGGGEWSPKDLIGHLASWEEYALDALAAWERGERAPIDELQFSVSINRLNRQNVARKAKWSLAKVKRDADGTHEELIAAIRDLSDPRWRNPATPRGRRPLGRRLGAILSGPAGPFRHDAAHHPSLAAFVEERSSVRSPRQPAMRAT